MMNDMQLSFETYADLAECMFELVEETKDIVYAVVFYDDAKQILKELGYIEETVFLNFNLEDPEWTEYNKEYYVTIDKDYEISVEPSPPTRGRELKYALPGTNTRRALRRPPRGGGN